MAVTRRIVQADIKAFTGQNARPVDEAVLKATLHARLYAPHTIYMVIPPATPDTLAALFDPNLDRDGIKAKLLQMGGAGGTGELTHRFSLSPQNRDLTDAYAAQVATHIYASVQHAALIQRLHNEGYEELAKILKGREISAALINHWVTLPPGPLPSEATLNKLFKDLSNISSDAEDLVARVDKALHEGLGINFQGIGTAKPLVEEAAYQQNMQYFKDFPALKALFETEAIKKALTARWGSHLPPYPEQLQTLWQDLSNPPLPLDIERVKSAISKAFNDDEGVEVAVAAELKPAILPDLAADAAYVRLLEGTKNLGKLSDILRITAIRNVIVAELKADRIKINEIESRLFDFYKELSAATPPTNDAVVTALINVLGIAVPAVDLRNALTALAAPNTVMTTGYLGTAAVLANNDPLLASVKESAPYMQLMRAPDNQKILADFPVLKNILENDQVKKVLMENHTLKDLKISDLVAQLQAEKVRAAPHVVTADTYKEIVKNFFPIATGKDAISLTNALTLVFPTLDQLNRALALHQFMQAKALDELPTLKRMLQFSKLQKTFLDAKKVIAPGFIDSLLTEIDKKDSADSSEAMRKHIAAATALDLQDQKIIEDELNNGGYLDTNEMAKQIRGELRLYQFMQTLRSSTENPKLIQLFEDQAIQQALLEHWKTEANWKWDANTFPDMVNNLSAAIANLPAPAGRAAFLQAIEDNLKKNKKEAPITGLADALGTKLNDLDKKANTLGPLASHKQIQLQAQFKQRLAALSKTNSALATLMKGKMVRAVLSDAWFKDNKFFPTEQEIKKLERDLIEIKPLNQALVIDVLAKGFRIPDKALLTQAITSDGALKDTAALTNLIVSCKYSVFLDQLNKTPELRALFEKPAIKTILETHWKTNPSPAPADFQQFFAEMAEVKEAKTDEATRAIQQLIFKVQNTALATELNTELNTAGLASPASVDTALAPLRAEARLAVFNRYASGLLSVPPLNAKIADLKDNWKAVNSPFLTKKDTLTALQTLSELDVKTATAKNVEDKLTPLFGGVALVPEAEIKGPAQVIGAARYDFFMLNNEVLLNNPNAETLKSILTNQAIRDALIQHWQGKDFNPKSLEELIDSLKNATTGAEIHRAFEAYFNLPSGSPFTAALSTLSLYPNTTAKLKDTAIVDKAKAESDRQYILLGLDQVALYERFYSAGVTLNKAAVDGLNKFLREKTFPPNLEAKEIASVISSRLAGSDKAQFDAKFPAGLNTQSVQDIQTEQKNINIIYRSFVSAGKNPGANLKDVNDPAVTTPVNQKLRSFFLRNNFYLGLKDRDSDLKKALLEVNYNEVNYNDFVQNYLLPATWVRRASHPKPTIDELKAKFTEKEFKALQETYFSSHLNAKSFERSLASLTQHNANLDRIRRLEEVLENVADQTKTSLVDAPYNQTLSARENNIDQKLANIEKLQENLEKLLKEREMIQHQLDILERTIARYPKNLGMSETLGGIEKSNSTLENICNILLKDSDKEIRDGAEQILKEIERAKNHHKNYADSIGKDKKDHPELVKTFEKIEGIHFAWQHKDKIEKLIAKSKNEEEIGKLKLSIEDAKKVHDSLKKIKENATLEPLKRPVAVYYTDYSKVSIELGKSFNSAEIQAEIKALQSKHEEVPSNSVSADLDGVLTADRVGGNDLIRADLQGKQTVMYDPTFDMVGVLSVDSREVKAGFNLMGGGSTGLIEGQEKPHTLLLFLAKKTAKYFWVDKEPDEKDAKGNVTAPGKTIRTKLDNAVEFWKNVQGKTPAELEKALEEHIIKKAQDGTNKKAQKTVENLLKSDSEINKTLAMEYKNASAKMIPTGDWGQRTLLPNANFFTVALININSIAAVTPIAHSDQKLIKDEKTGQPRWQGRVSRGVPIKVETKDYMLYVAIMCAARMKGYKVINKTGFPAIPENKMNLYMAALSNPRNTEYRDLFKLTEAQLRGQESKVSQTQLIEEKSVDLDEKIREDAKEPAPEWPKLKQ